MRNTNLRFTYLLTYLLYRRLVAYRTRFIVAVLLLKRLSTDCVPMSMRHEDNMQTSKNDVSFSALTMLVG